jgi:hypothetical protein
MSIKWKTWISPADAIKAPFRPAHDRKRLWGEIKERLFSGWKRLHSNRNPYSEDAPDMENFHEMMAHWGIYGEDDIQYVIRKMWWRIVGAFAWTAVMVFSAYQYGIGPLAIVPVVVAFVFFVVATLSATYRITVLKNRHFVLFRDWFFGRR